MRRFAWVMVLVAVAGMLFAAGAKEEVREITVLGTTSGEIYEYATRRMQEDFPGVTVRNAGVDLSDGSTLSMDALLAAGTPPNVYEDWIGRASKYMVPEFALPLQDYVRDLDAYYPQYLDLYTRDGNVYGLPMPINPQGMAVNMDIMREIGFTPTWDWTIADFLTMAELVKQRYGGEKWATGMFAATQSGDYLINNWFPAFGAEWFAEGYEKTTIAKRGASVHAFFQLLAREGYIPPNSAALADADYVHQVGGGRIAAAAMMPGWIKVYQDAAIKNGVIDKPWAVEFFPFPTATGKPVPTFASGHGLVIHNTGTEADKWAARWAEYLNDAWSQLNTPAVTPTRGDTGWTASDPLLAQTIRIANDHGVYNSGITLQFFAAFRPQHFPVLQKVLRLELTPEDSIKEYEARINQVLAEK